jgi:hypothetical protein
MTQHIARQRKTGGFKTKHEGQYTEREAMTLLNGFINLKIILGQRDGKSGGGVHFVLPI